MAEFHSRSSLRHDRPVWIVAQASQVVARLQPGSRRLRTVFNRRERAAVHEKPTPINK